jgi:RNA polymerase sigma factor (sigma-70 family)
VQDTEDAFQATFLVLARKASVVKREALAGWLYAVAFRTARQARAANARRQARERHVEDMPDPEMAPAEPQDWRPVLDQELSRLPEKHRAAIVLCDLEGVSRKEAARQLRVPEGTVSSRLANARRMLAQRLARRGVTLSGGALAVAMSQDAASAQVPPRLVSATGSAAAGQLAGASPAAVVLTREVLKAMSMTKLKVVVGVLVAVVVLGAGGLAYRAGGAQAAPPAAKPLSEVEALRRENELLKLNLQLVLEKVRAQQEELQALKGRVQVLDKRVEVGLERVMLGGFVDLPYPARPDAFQDVQKALKALQGAGDKQARQRALERLEAAMKRLRGQVGGK